MYAMRTSNFFYLRSAIKNCNCKWIACKPTNFNKDNNHNNANITEYNF